MGIKYAVNEDFFDTWSRGSAYLLGFIYADGSLENAQYIRGKYLRITSTDRKHLLRLRNCLGSQHPLICRPPVYTEGKSIYLLRIGSHKIYDALTRRQLHPRKSLTLRLPNVPGPYLKDFIRGYFDGDGCVYLELAPGRRQPTIVRKLTSVFTSGSRLFLVRLAQSLYRCAGLSQRRVYQSHRSYQLRYSTRDSIALFKFLYNNVSAEVYLERKYNIFKRYFQRRPQVIDKNVARILRAVLPGQVVK